MTDPLEKCAGMWMEVALYLHYQRGPIAKEYSMI